ncbi:MAG: Xaa-Pro dipeptidase [Candidatus Bathyarchaeota archaeon BA2]|nr:MAG: Xaa-Pro dipeptidase [Candidatus Bathyarchaeota archaeon BA2]
MRGDLDGILAEKGAEALLLYSESFKNANMYYLTKFLAPDPFIFFKKVDADPVIVLNQMEYPRAQKESIIKDVRSYVDYNFMEVVKSAEEPHLGTMKFIATVAKKELSTNTRICVPHNFPTMATDVLREEGLTIKPMLEVVERARETKDADEVGEIRGVQAVAEEVMVEAIDLIANAEADTKGTLFVKKDGEKGTLTVGKVKSYFGHKFLDHRCVTEEEIIVACGPKGSDPHYFGDPRDELKANQPIILDVYPRSIQKRYWTDITRTIVKGKASEKVKKMFEAVLEAKNASMDALQAGALGSDVYGLCCDVLEKAGYETTRGGKQIKRGFTHSLGHGVGLELHEGTGLNELYRFPLKEHSVVTVEPGLYDPDVGGMRIEDIVEVKKGGCNNLTKMEIRLEI